HGDEHPNAVHHGSSSLASSAAHRRVDYSRPKKRPPNSAGVWSLARGVTGSATAHATPESSCGAARNRCLPPRALETRLLARFAHTINSKIEARANFCAFTIAYGGPSTVRSARCKVARHLETMLWFSTAIRAVSQRWFHAALPCPPTP